MARNSLNSAQVAQVFDRGAVIKSALFLTRVLPNNLPYSRMSPIVARKIGSAVLRNRIKRRLRAAWRQNQKLPLHTAGKNADYCLIAKSQVAEVEWKKLVAAIRKIIPAP